MHKTRRTRAEINSLLLDARVMAVLRLRSSEWVLPAATALLDGGIGVLELTLTTPGALEILPPLKEQFGHKALIGVGSVVSAYQAKSACSAGADFIVSPICRPALVSVAHDDDRPIFLGAFTPTEAQLGYEAGADFTKIFPAEPLGPGFFKSILAPLPHLRLVPTGGIEPENARTYLEAGCVLLGAGSSLIPTSLAEQGRWTEVTAKAQALVAAVQDFPRA